MRSCCRPGRCSVTSGWPIRTRTASSVPGCTPPPRIGRDARDPSYLYTGNLLGAAASTAARIDGDARHAPLSQAEQDFLRASRRASRRRARIREGLVATLIALVLGLGTVALAAFNANR